MRKNNFADNLVKLEPEQFCGVARILKVDLVDEEKNPRDFWEICIDIVDNYEKFNRKKRRELDKIVADSALS